MKSVDLLDRINDLLEYDKFTLIRVTRKLLTEYFYDILSSLRLELISCTTTFTFVESEGRSKVCMARCGLVNIIELNIVPFLGIQIGI